MTENIRSIFNCNIELLGNTEKAIYYFRQQQYDKALGIVANSIDRMNYAVEAIIKDQNYFNLVTTETVMDMLTRILEAKKNRDFILLADLLELQMVSFLCSVQELIISKEEIVFDDENYKDNRNTLIKRGIGFQDQMEDPINHTELVEKGYRIEFTSCGLMTLAAENNGLQFYFHTNGMIQTEAFLLASHWYKERIKRYIIYGFGMGYHIAELQLLAPDAEIEVYESDINVIQLACAFSDMKKIFANDHFRLFFDPELEQLKEQITSSGEADSLCIHYPSYMNIKDEEKKNIFGDLVPWSKTIEYC